MSTAIDVEVKVQYIDEQSQPEKSQFVFAYTIKIENNSDCPAQLISRYWKIIDANNGIQEVQGEGVVGEQPKLEPGESYTYTSGVVLPTATGTMSGHYVMRGENDGEFEATIPTFALVPPHALH